MLAADAAAVEGVQRPEGASVGMHVCRGNNSSRWLAEGGYDPIAERLFGSLPVDRFLLEFDDDRACGFEPLRYVPQGTVVVLGLVSTKTPQLEDVDEVVARIDEAAQYVDIDNLAVSPQCGFASVAKGGNKLSSRTSSVSSASSRTPRSRPGASKADREGCLTRMVGAPRRSHDPAAAVNVSGRPRPRESSRPRLDDANLNGADLTSATLTSAVLTYVKLENAELSGADLESANLDNALVTYADLAGANLEPNQLPRGLPGSRQSVRREPQLRRPRHAQC